MVDYQTNKMLETFPASAKVFGDDRGSFVKLPEVIRGANVASPVKSKSILCILSVTSYASR
jgi:hypothetical protein